MTSEHVLVVVMPFTVAVQAIVNEDLSGEAAAMRAEIARLTAEVASFKSELALLQQARGVAVLRRNEKDGTALCSRVKHRLITSLLFGIGHIMGRG